MAGGTYSQQDKRLPGAYVNVKSAPQAIVAGAGTRGVVFTILSGLGWGQDGIVEVTASSDFNALLGHPLTDTEMIGLRLILANAQKVIIYNVNPGDKASGNSEPVPWTFQAKYNGTAGNDIAVTVAPDMNNITKFVVTTTYKSVLVDKQSVTKASDLHANNYMVPTIVEEAQDDDGVEMLGNIVSPISVKLSGGEIIVGPDTTTAVQKAMETYEFNTVVAAAADDMSPLHSLLATAVERLREERGRKVQAVVPVLAGTASDYEGVIVVGNNLILEDGFPTTYSQSAAFVAGATAAAEPNESLTYKVIPGVVNVAPRFTDEEAIEQLAKGRLIFIAQRGQAKILQDINSLHTFTTDKSRDFSKNRPLRVLDAIANTVRETWEDNFIGQVTNDATGRDLFKATLAEYLTTLMASGAIQNFVVDDITVTQGTDKDSVLVALAVTPTDAMEKLYMEVTSR
jgi:Phage tail sheath protein.